MTEPYFHQVIALHEMPNLEWERLAKQIPHLPRGWYELSQFPIDDRIEFTQDYWLSKLSDEASSSVQSRVKNFFSQLEDIGFYMTQDKERDPWEVHMVYSLKGARHFLQGSPPANESRIEGLRKGFNPFNFPPDYLAFLKIHDGFNKYTDTGVIKIREMARTYQRFQRLLTHEKWVCSHEQAIAHDAMIPFYESSQLHCYQCFCANQPSTAEVENISFFENSLLDQEGHRMFSSFLHWLLFYLEHG